LKGKKMATYSEHEQRMLDIESGEELDKINERQKKMANFKDHPPLRPCWCGSGLERHAVRDARGIFLCYVCEKCRKEKLSKYRPDVLFDPDYWHDEPIDED
jgi:hypothetical protein